MSNTEIQILEGHATQRHVSVFFDGVLIEVIDIGTFPTGDHREPWLSIGGQTVKIPLGAYYEVTHEGKLIHHGEGYQHVFRDLSSKQMFNEDEDPVTQSSGSSAAQRIIKELYTIQG
jgi:hypothetical protein